MPRKKTLEEVKQFFKDKGCKLLEESYKNSNTKMKYKCSCGNISQISLDKFRDGQRCKKCIPFRKKDPQKYEFEFVKSFFEKKGCRLISTEYRNVFSKLEYICSCGETYRTPFHDFKRGQRCRQCGNEKISGENHGNWNSNLTDEERIVNRDYEEYKEWRSLIFKKDSYTCKVCGTKNPPFNAHHLDGYNWCVDKRLDPNNGVTLCTTCHTTFHKKYGSGGNTLSQYLEFKNLGEY